MRKLLSAPFWPHFIHQPGGWVGSPFTFLYVGTFRMVVFMSIDSYFPFQALSLWEASPPTHQRGLSWGARVSSRSQFFIVSPISVLLWFRGPLFQFHLFLLSCSMLDSFKIASLNVNGLGNPLKRKKGFWRNWRKDGSHVAFLKETHLSKKGTR